MPGVVPLTVLDIAAERGLSPATLLARANVTVPPSELFEAGLTLGQQADLVEVVAEALGDPRLGFEIGWRLPPTALGSVGYAILSSATVTEALELLQRFWHLVGRATSITLDTAGETGSVTLDVRVPMDAEGTALIKEITLDGQAKSPTVTAEDLEHYCGVRKHKFGMAEEQDLVGHVTGLAWTQVGGDILTIESAVVPGKGRLTHTGSLGDVMKESIQAAMTVVRSRARTLGIRSDFHEKHDLHIHVPEGATPKDGPSAGIGMCTALVSALTQIPVRADVAMTGEITLRGQVLPIGGLKEKLLAAHRGGIKTVIIPDENQRDLKEIPDNIKADVDIKPVKWIDEVLDIALAYPPKPLSEEEDKVVSGEPKGDKNESGQLSTH